MGCEVRSPQLQALNAECKLVCTYLVCRNSLVEQARGLAETGNGHKAVSHGRSPTLVSESGDEQEHTTADCWVEHVSQVHVESWKERKKTGEVYCSAR